MAKSLSELYSTKSDKPPIMLFYGKDGVGKTSLASEWPDCIYIQTEGENPPDDVEMPSPGTMESFDELIAVLKQLATTEHEFKTVIIDSLDGVEPLVWEKTCKRIGADSINSNEKGSPASFGRGWTEADREWTEYFKAIKALKELGIAVIQIAHPKVKIFESPTTDPYARYQLKLQERASDLLRERSDIVGFMDFRVTLKEKEIGFNKKSVHGEGGGDRQIHFEERPGFLAKRRAGLPASVSIKKGEGYTAISKYVNKPTGLAPTGAKGEE
jgi:hypothetical protein